VKILNKKKFKKEKPEVLVDNAKPTLQSRQKNKLIKDNKLTKRLRVERIEKELMANNDSNAFEDNNVATVEKKNISLDVKKNDMNDGINDKVKTSLNNDDIIIEDNYDKLDTNKIKKENKYKQKVESYITLIIVIISFSIKKTAEYTKKYINTIRIIFFIVFISFFVKVTLFSIIEYYYAHQVKLQTQIFNQQDELEKQRRLHTEKLQNNLFKQQVNSQKIAIKNELIIEYLREGQRRSVELFENIRLSRSTIHVLEKKGSGGISIKTLENYRKESVQIKIIGKNVNSKIIEVAAEIVESEISKYVNCLKQKSKNCSIKFSLEPFITLNNSFSKTIQQFIE